MAYRRRHRETDRAKADAEYKANEPKRLEAERQQNLAEFSKLTPDSPLKDWLVFRYSSNELREQALEGIRKLPRRQIDAESMLQQGLDYFWEDFPELGLQASPIVCQRARKFILAKVQDIQPPHPEAPPKFIYMADRIEPYLPTMKWLVDHQCECDDELAALERVVRMYPESPERNKMLDALTSIRRAP